MRVRIGLNWGVFLTLALLLPALSPAQIVVYPGPGGGGGGGNVSVSGTPTPGQLAAWTDATHIQGISTLDMQITTLDLTAATRTAPNKTGTTAPAGCTVGDTFFDTDATAGLNVHACTAAGVYTDPVTASPTWSGTHTFTNNPKIPGFADTAGTVYARLTTGFLMIGPNKLAYGATVAGAADVALERIASGTFEVNSGTGGTLRDLKYRKAWAFQSALGTVGATGSIDITLAQSYTLTSTASTNMALTPTGVGTAGQEHCLIITSDATGGDVVTFASPYRTTGTMTLTASKLHTICFLSNGSNWVEKSRVLAIN